MVKRAIICLIISLCIGTSAFAGGAGSCILPVKETTEKIGVGGGFDYNFVGSRLNDFSNGWWGDNVKSMKVENLYQVGGKFMYGLTDTLNVYARVGGCGYDLKFANKDDADAEIDLNVKDGVYTGIGANGLFPLNNIAGMEIPNLFWGFDAHANGYLNDVDSLSRNGVDATGVDGTLYGFDGVESIYLAYKYEIEKAMTTLVPYIGAYHSWITRGTLDELTYTTSASANAEKLNMEPAFDIFSFGLILGIDIEVTKYISVNVEGRVIGENAISTSVIAKF